MPNFAYCKIPIVDSPKTDNLPRARNARSQQPTYTSARRIISTSKKPAACSALESTCFAKNRWPWIRANLKCWLWFEIDGSKGSLAWNSESPNTLWIGRRDRASEVLPKDPALLSPAARGFAAYPGGHAEGYPDTFVQLFREFYGYLDAGDMDALRPFPTFANGNHELILCEAIAKSAQNQAWVPVLWP
jgi:predicted dehydrogenase